MGGDIPLVQGVGEELGDGGIAVDHKDLLGSGAEAADPLQQMIPVGVGGQTGEIDDAGVDGDLLTEELDALGALQQTAAQRALTLIAHKDHGGLGAPQIVLQVVANAAGIAHAGGGDDDLGALVGVQGLGLLGRLGQGQAGEGEQVLSALYHFDGLLVQITPQITGVDLGGLGGQRTVHHHLEVGDGLDHALVLDLAQEIEKLLSAAHGEGGDDDVAASGEHIVNEGGQCLGIALGGRVVTIPVGGFHDDVVGLLDGLGIPDDGLIHVAQIAGKDQFPGHALLGGPNLHAGGAQQMARVGEADAHAGADVDVLTVLAHLNQLQGRLGIGEGVQGLHDGTTGALTFLVGPLGVALLNVGGVAQHDAEQLPGQTGGVDGAGEALLDQQRHPAGVVDVGVGDDDVVDLVGGEGQGVVVVFVPTLLQTAVDEQFGSVDFQTVTAARDGMGGAEECKFHTKTPSISYPDYSLLLFDGLFYQQIVNSGV